MEMVQQEMMRLRVGSGEETDEREEFVKEGQEVRGRWSVKCL